MSRPPSRPLSGPLRRRWRLVLPPALALLLITVTLIVHAIELPDDTDESFLSPVSAAGDGARDLAARLTARGVAVDRRLTTADALAALSADSTLFVTTPALVHPAYLTRLRTLPAGVRVVLVAPRAPVLRGMVLDVAVGGPRWTAAAVGSDCPDRPGTAAALRLRYASGAAVRSCYGGGLIELDRFTLVGASDPFRNDRLAEHDNAALAESVLARGSRVVWLDLHAEEDPPPVVPRPGGTPDDPAPDDETGEEPRGGDQPGDEPGDSGTEPRDSTERRAAPPPPSSPLESVPAAFWATVLLLVLAALAAAAAAARRLGAPVSEPLPARVRAAESIAGLGGLYARARARDESLARLREATRQRLAAHFGLAPDTPVEQLAERVAAVTGRPPAEVRARLYGEPVYDDDGLVDQATAVQALLAEVRGRGGVA